MIRHVFKRKRKRNGRTVADRCYSARYQLAGMAKPRTVALKVSDKRVAEQRLAELIKQAEHEHAGLLLPAQRVAAAQRRILEHLKDYLADLKARDKDDQYRSDQSSRVRRLVSECNWTTPSSITAESFTNWRASSPLQLRAARPLSAKTLNDYLAAINSLMAWLVAAGRIERNPLAGVKRVDTRGRETFTRRALTIGEVGKLLAVSGERSALYLTALLTAYRRDTLYRLTWANVDLDGNPPTIRPAVSTIKNREQHPQPIRDDLAATLRQLRPADAKPTDRVFVDLLPRWGVAFLEADLTRAGVSIQTTDGKIDFHALRHTAATWAAAVGESSATVKAFTGHKTDSQLKRYTHNQHLPVQALTAAMPRFDGTHIGTHEMDADRPSVTSGVTPDGDADRGNAGNKKGLRHGAALNGTPCHNPNKVTPTGFEPVLPG